MYMKQFLKMEYAIIVLFFLLVLSASSLAIHAMILKEISYQPILAQNPLVYFFAGFGYLLTLPVLVICIMPVHFLQLIGKNVAFDGLYTLIPFLTALLYSFFIMLFLTMYKQRNVKNK